MTPAAIEAAPAAPAKLTKKDFESGQDVRWCPGCGDYAILAQVQKLLPDLGVPIEKIVFVSGIGCSSRFPYYMNTYGFHTIHGRAPAIATGLKASQPDLSVWVVTGDGDGLSIGGNHLIHAIRRNLNINILLFNNRIYGLTKGQYSPTSEQFKITPSSPAGSLDAPFNPIALSLGAQSTFVARTLDRDLKHLGATLRRAYDHKGTSFVEIYQNCNIFNDGAFKNFTEKNEKPESTVNLQHGEPLVYGARQDKGIVLNGFTLESVNIREQPEKKSDLLVHDEHCEDSTLAMILSGLTGYDGLPLPIGVFRDVDRPRYEEGLTEQIERAVAKSGSGDLDALLSSGETWEVKA